MSGVCAGRWPEKQGKEGDEAPARAWHTVEGPHTAEEPPGAWVGPRGPLGLVVTSVLWQQAAGAPVPTSELMTVTAWQFPSADSDHSDSCYPRVPAPMSTKTGHHRAPSSPRTALVSGRASEGTQHRPGRCAGWPRLRPTWHSTHGFSQSRKHERGTVSELFRGLLTTPLPGHGTLRLGRAPLGISPPLSLLRVTPTPPAGVLSEPTR